jgi:peptidyl-prolyl cis-trans isomerase C
MEKMEQMMSQGFRFLPRAVVVAACATLLCLGCPAKKNEPRGAGASRPGPVAEPKNEAPGAKDPDRNVVLAQIGSTTITVGSLSDELNGQSPYLRMRFSSLERRKEFLKNLVRFEVLAQEARRRQLQRDPEVVRRVKHVMVQRMMDQIKGDMAKMEDLPDKDIEAYYRANASLYHQPAKVRVSQIVTSTAAEAQKVLGLAKAKPGDAAHFAGLVKTHSIDPGTKERRGDLDYFTRDDTRLPKPVVEAAFALKSLWAIAGPIKTDKGFVVLMKTGQLEPIDRPLEMEKTGIRNRLYNERRTKAVEKFMDDLQAKAKVQINEANLAKVKIDPSMGPVPPHMRRGPGPRGGGVP